MHVETLWVGGHLATCDNHKDYGIIYDAAIAIDQGKIAWLGPRADLNPVLTANKTIDFSGQWLTPGLIDCHTHLVYAGNRAQEFAQRLQGTSYQTIAQNGGGIQYTVQQTRAASADALLHASQQRLARILSEGVTTIEIKSGYGLDLETEAKMLRCARQLGEQFAVNLHTTFLGAHCLPPEYQGNADAYIDMICEQMLPRLHEQGLIDAVDGFCETIAFTPAQIERVFKCAQRLGLPVKLHADQLSDNGGAQLAAQFNALSADHVEYSSEAGIQAMAQSGTVAVLLPGAYYCLREDKKPPLAWLRQYQTPFALATDCNPGSSPLQSLLLCMNLACTLWQVTPQEALLAVTQHAAQALGIGDSHGSLRVGKQADLALWAIDHPGELIYQLGSNPCLKRIIAGEIVQAL